MGMTVERARDIIGACVEALSEDTSATRFGMLFAEHPDAPDAVLAYFRARYVDQAAALESWELHPVGHQLMGLIVSFASAPVRQGFIALGLEVLSDAGLGEIVRYASKPDELARAVIDALDEPEPRPRNASELAYHTFDAGGEGMQPSADLALVMDEKLRLYERTRAR